MRKLSELTNREIKDLLVSLNAELAILSKAPNVKKLLSDFAEARKGNAKLTYMELITDIVPLLMVEYESSMWNIIGAIAGVPSDKVGDMNNVETIEIVTGFLSVEAYRKLFLQATQ